ncbi:MAG TPA: rod shape-determining protein MreC [Thermoanaerobaculia bacterium]|nr:rod shape-determining protein MreC [Thermoanaerobaculia bacterium]
MDERRIAWLLILVLATQLTLLALQVPGAGGRGTFLGSLGLRLVGPAARTVGSLSGSFRSAGEGVRLQGRLVDENRRLKREVEELQLELLRLEDVRGEADRLASALRYTAPPIGRLRAADVVYLDFSSWLTTLVLYAGDQPVQLNQTVLAPTGLVGRVVEVAPPYAKVQLLTDRAASVGAMIARSRRQGVVRGAGSGALELDYVPVQAEVKPGDRVLTAGIDGVFPRGIPIGTVVSVKAGAQLFHEIGVAAAVDLGALDRVYLLDYEPVPERLQRTSDVRR